MRLESLLSNLLGQAGTTARGGSTGAFSELLGQTFDRIQAEPGGGEALSRWFQNLPAESRAQLPAELQQRLAALNQASAAVGGSGVRTAFELTPAVVSDHRALDTQVSEPAALESDAVAVLARPPGALGPQAGLASAAAATFESGPGTVSGWVGRAVGSLVTPASQTGTGSVPAATLGLANQTGAMSTPAPAAASSLEDATLALRQWAQQTDASLAPASLDVGGDDLERVLGRLQAQFAGPLPLPTARLPGLGPVSAAGLAEATHVAAASVPVGNPGVASLIGSEGLALATGGEALAGLEAELQRIGEAVRVQLQQDAEANRDGMDALASGMADLATQSPLLAALVGGFRDVGRDRISLRPAVAGSEGGTASVIAAPASLGGLDLSSNGSTGAGEVGLRALNSPGAGVESALMPGVTVASRAQVEGLSAGNGPAAVATASGTAGAIPVAGTGQTELVAPEQERADPLADPLMIGLDGRGLERRLGQTEAPIDTLLPRDSLQRPLGTPGFAPELGQQLRIMAQQQGVQEARLRLNPEALGPLDVRIEVAEDSVRVELNAQQGFTREQLEAAAPRLRDLLSQGGFAQVSVEVGSGFNPNLAQGSGQGGERDGSGRQGSGGAASAETGTAGGSAGRLAGRAGPEGVDTFA